MSIDIPKISSKIVKYALSNDLMQLRSLPEELVKKRREMSIQHIINSEPASSIERDRELVQRVMDKATLSNEQRQQLFHSTNNNSILGRLLSASIAGIAAPLLVGNFVDNSPLASTMTYASAPIGALAGLSLYDMLFSESPNKSGPFSYSIPVRSQNE